MCFLFALFVALSPNPYDKDGLPYLVPLHYSVTACEAAEYYPDVEPEEVVAMLVAEHGGTYPYPADSVGKSGEVGLLQITNWERRRFNFCHKIENVSHEKHYSKCGAMNPTGIFFGKEDLYDWRSSIILATFTMHRIKYVHTTKRRCLKKVQACTVKKDINGALVPDCKMIKQKHTPSAHYRCGVKSRERCRTKYRDKLIRKFSKWKHLINPLVALRNS